MVGSTSALIYESKATWKSTGNTYRIFDDRIELQFRLFLTKIVIHKEEFVRIEVYRPPVVRTSLWSLKIDYADLHIHVGIERNRGFMRRIRFTPEDPHEFKRRVDAWAAG